MIDLSIDGVPFQITSDHVLWSPPSIGGQFVPAPTELAQLARDLVCRTFEQREQSWFVGVYELGLPVVQEHSDRGEPIPDSRMPTPATGEDDYRPKRVITKTLPALDDPHKLRNVIIVLEWDRPNQPYLNGDKPEIRRICNDDDE